MCVTDLPGDPDGILVLHDVMELVDEAYEPGEGSTSSVASPIVFDSDDEDLDVPPLRPRRGSSRRGANHRRPPPDERCSGALELDESRLGVTSLAAPPMFCSPDFSDTDEDAMGGVYHGAVTAKLKQPLEQWRLKSSIMDVRVTPTPTSVETPPLVKKSGKVKATKDVKGTPKHRMNPKDEVQFLRERVRQLEQTLETLRLQALADREKAMETAIVFNLVPQPELLAPSNKSTDLTPGSPAQTIKDSDRMSIGAGSPAAVDLMATSNPNASDGLWERIATFQKQEYEKSMKQNKRLREMAEQQLRALKQLEGAFRNSRAVSQ